ncbi:MAG: MarR family transcriptional regulator [Gemmatimonadetes bacterium]|uniref:MarR family transcriptional regulator n=1 Tax=Candidatus Kutchimonas denitrificans TaxID=3056748 RepID=A0AAE4Z9L9_9BACT|nr:MarR family transcriptional regulator [Gemmatimonadota bacterium]NIR74036.1 MarR family transcriptional regulator [Candidatus Kutchimonas denitrificans]NIS03025.1 MarR family transcriptional regulator [Gemmatimonadota bacterium]NIT68742.1 MarR family transcriptional regulator [Gemmatimonadota bacterium]NIU53323.1 MarR family transcriptional regulator [Gemmatimonadota bacterium]
MTPRSRQPARSTSLTRTADRLHSAAIHLLRRLRVEDQATGLSAPRLSALSVVVFAGPITIGDLAAAEGVRPPTVSRLVKGLEEDGLVARRRDPDDRRVQWIRATIRGRRALEKGQDRRVARLAAELARLPREEQRLLADASRVLQRLTGSAERG